MVLKCTFIVFSVHWLGIRSFDRMFVSVEVLKFLIKCSSAIECYTKVGLDYITFSHSCFVEYVMVMTSVFKYLDLPFSSDSFLFWSLGKNYV